MYGKSENLTKNNRVQVIKDKAIKKLPVNNINDQVPSLLYK